METKILTRKKFEARPEAEEINRQPYARAKEVLGYSPDALRNGVYNNKLRECEQHVANVLEALGIDPLNMDAVRKYKQAKVDEIQSKGSNKFVKYMHSKDGEFVVTFFGICTFVPFIVLAVAAFGLGNDQGFTHVRFFEHAFEFFGLVFASWIICMIARHKEAITYMGRWEAGDIAAYRDPIPAFALERALQIKEVLPAAKFFVDVLHENYRGLRTEYKPAPPDPFLWMVYEDLIIYLDVWDEPKFEGRRTI